MTREEAIDLVIKVFDTLEGECNIECDWSKEHNARDMAIKALKHEPCEDAVSRKGMYFKLTNGAYPNETIEQFIDRLVKELEAMPPVAPTQRWIPVTEDAPPKGTICLWCNKQGSVFTSEITYRTERNSYVGKHGYFSNGLKNHGDIVARMPLPEPYKESEEE